MLKLKIKEIVLSRGHIYPNAWLIKTCKFGQKKTHNLLNNLQKSINSKDLTTLCLALHCEPSDLYYWEESRYQPIDPSQPCTQLISTPLKENDWVYILKNLKPHEIDALRMTALEHIKKPKEG